MSTKTRFKERDFLAGYDCGLRQDRKRIGRTFRTDEQKDYLKELGVSESGLEKVIKEGYKILDLISFLTAGEKEVRAWTIKNGTNAQNAAGVIHTDFIKNFIKAEVVPYQDFVQNGGWKACSEHGKTRFEGRDYIMKDGEVVEFKIGT